jgi:ATP-binding cassette, subfamily C, bacterial PrsD
MLMSGRFLSAILIFSIAVNLLTLSSPLFMMQVYDRVMVSHSLPTLVSLLVLVCVLQAAQGLLHLLRARMLRRLADHVDDTCEEAAFVATVEPKASCAQKQSGDTPLQALSDVRTFIAGNGLSSLFDLPWVVVFTVIMFLLHPWLGILAVAFTVAIAGCSLIAQILKGKQPNLNDKAAAFRDPFRDASRNQTIKGLGLGGYFRDRWIGARQDGRQDKRSSQRWSDLFQTFARIFRSIQASVILGLAAYLTLENAATFGVMMASSIIAGRISAPLDGVINSWKEIKAARVAWPRLKEIVKEHHQDDGGGRELSEPLQSLKLQNVSASPPGRSDDRSLVSATLSANAGDLIGVIGPSGSGKSTLINVLAGAWPCRSGKIRFD